MFFLSQCIWAQTFSTSNLHQKRIATIGIIRLDSVSIVPNSLLVKGVDTSFYFLDFVNANITWKKKLNVDSVSIQYRTFPFLFSEVVSGYNYDSIKNFFIAQQPFVFNKVAASDFNSTLNLNSIQYNGSFGRNLSFGNNQDVVLNSQFNLQMNGFISDSIEIAASITDNNIPIQPDGNTQQLNEFDKVWLQFKKKNWELNLGDLDIRKNELHFFNFYKRLQGASFSTHNSWKKNKNDFLISAAIAKGKFFRNVFQGQEGNQGPYRLQGANNELFFIILGGTERVFIDGELMQRGEDQDYTINYNTAEISFTPKRMITKDKRIQVEFEYADRNYLNSMIVINNKTEFGEKLKINIALYNNSDAKNSTINQTLDNKQKNFLSQIGDSIQQAYYPVFSIDSFSTSKILYAKRLVVYPGGSDSIYVYSTHPDSAKYSLQFIDVGLGNGNYISFFNGANGKVYKWVQPIAGKPQGNFEPAIFLATPKKLQMMAASVDYIINKNSNVLTEFAVSNYDINTFSSKNKENNVGFGFKTLFNNSSFVTAKKNIQVQTQIGYEFVDKNFKSLERLRSVEFYRDWGLEFLPESASEHLPKLSLKLHDNKRNSLEYKYEGYFRNQDFKGHRNSLEYHLNSNGFSLRNTFNLSSFSNNSNSGFFLRPKLDWQKTFKKLNNYVVGFNYQLEKNKIQDKIQDTVNANSFSFQTISAFIKSDIEKLNKWSLQWFTRSDALPYNKQLVEIDKSNNITLGFELLSNPKHQVKMNSTFRQLIIKNSVLSLLKPENSLLGRLEYWVNEWNGFLTGSILFESGSGQEQRRDFSFIEVPAGRGEYAWNDYNNDGIKQLNEFEIALFPDQAKFIKIFTPTNQFIKANYNQFNYSILLNPRMLYKANRNANNFWSKIILQSTFQTAKKNIAEAEKNWNPFKSSIQDTSLISLTNQMINTLSFNRFSNKWGLDLIQSKNSSKALLTYGLESRQIKEYMIKARFNFLKVYTVELTHKNGMNELLTPSFSNRNFNIHSISLEPKIVYTAGTNFRTSVSYQFLQKENSKLLGAEKSVVNALNAESKFNTINSISLNGKLTINNINYTGLTNTTVSYILLDGLLPGKNILWNFDIIKRLGKFLELSIQYEGRKPDKSPVIHIGRASLRAIL